MALLNLEQELERSRSGQAFRTAFDQQSWMGLWCDDCLIEQDKCPLIAVAARGRTPAAWQDRLPGSQMNRYTCTEWCESEEQR